MRGERAYDMDPLIGRGTYYVKYCLGTVPVAADGSAIFNAPAGVELYFQALDAAGITHGKGGKVKVIGFDFNRFALRNVQAGYWDCNIQCSPRQAAEIASWIKLGKNAPTGKVFQKEIIADTATITDQLITEKGINADPGKGVITK